MGIPRLALGLVLACSVSTALSAQLTQIPNTGCSDGIAAGGPLIAVGDQAPTLGNLTFTLQHTCPIGANASFFIFGTCFTSAGADWDLLNPCFASWSSAPASCGRGYDMLQNLSGAPVRQSGKVQLSFPIPNIPALVTITRTQPICVQFVCVNLGAAAPCVEVSAGVQLMIQ